MVLSPNESMTYGEKEFLLDDRCWEHCLNLGDSIVNFHSLKTCDARRKAKATPQRYLSQGRGKDAANAYD